MVTFTKGQIVMYPFPFTNLKGKKLRPCLILSNEMRDDILLCQITSQGIQKDEFTVAQPVSKPISPPVANEPAT
jgi:mRNA interferase MazF